MYSFFDLVIKSEIALPELVEVTSGDHVIYFQLSTLPFSSKRENWLHHWRLADGTITISCSKIEGGYYLRFPDLADFQILDKCADIQCYPMPGVAEDSIRHLLIDQVIPRIVGHQGSIVLHASAIVINGVAILFLGETGWGKSTLASSFHSKGYQLLADDCVLLSPEENNINVIPSYSGIRLLADSVSAVLGEDNNLHNMTHYSAKKRLILSRGVSKQGACSLPIGAIFNIVSPDKSPAEEVVIEEIKGAKVVTELLKHSFVLDVTDKEKLTRKFYMTSTITASDLPVYRLGFPRQYDFLERVHDSVEDILSREQHPEHCLV